MPISPLWALMPRGDHSSSPETDQSSSSGTTGNVYPSDSFADDLFRDKFMGIAKGGSNGEKIMRGFLIGLAIGLVVACFVCCCVEDNEGAEAPPAADEEENATSSAPPA
ncbi:hypothetical protein RAB80_013264 [Fusarium oxysporum f. sp. vasinfectum]|nr:hypothetical protein RAB80_013264 [Fusarium oxysporum f. sp. vasinfectum]